MFQKMVQIAHPPRSQDGPASPAMVPRLQRPPPLEIRPAKAKEKINKNGHFFARWGVFFAKWGLFFAKWGLLLYSIGETIPKQGKAASVAEALADTQAELEAQSSIPSSGKESGKESADSAKLQSDGALNVVIKSY